MNRSPLLSAILVCVSAFAGCGAEPPPEAAGRDVVRPALGFAIDVPEGWTWNDRAGDIVLEMVPRPAGADAAKQRAADGDGQTAADGENDTARRRARTGPVVHVAVIDREGMTLDAWADEAVAISRQLQADLEVLKREPARTAGDREALVLVLKNPRGLEPFVQRLRLTQTETRSYALIATAPESDWPAAERAVETCFDSFVVW